MVQKDVFILGAGFSKAIDCRMPTTKELTDIVTREYSIPLPIPLNTTEENGREFKENIEFLLTYLVQNQPWLEEGHNTDNKETAKQVYRAMLEVISKRSSQSAASSSIPEWLGLLLKLWDEREAVVMTLNYDTLIEQAAIATNNQLELNNLYPNVPPVGSPRSSVSSSTFKYYKLHGSINWQYAETVSYVLVPPWGSISGAAVTYTPIVIPPVFDKSVYLDDEHMRELWHDAGRKLNAARRVFVIGYSLPISDLGMRFFLTHSQPNPKTDWYIVDKDKEVATRYKRLLEPKQNIHDRFAGIDDPLSEFTNFYGISP